MIYIASEQFLNKSHMLRRLNTVGQHFPWNCLNGKLAMISVGNQYPSSFFLPCLNKVTGFNINWRYLPLIQNKQHLLDLSKQQLSLKLTAQGVEIIGIYFWAGLSDPTRSMLTVPLLSYAFLTVQSNTYLSFMDSTVLSNAFYKHITETDTSIGNLTDVYCFS